MLIIKVSKCTQIEIQRCLNLFDHSESWDDILIHVCQMIIQLWRVNNEQKEKSIVLILLSLMFRSARTDLSLDSSRRCGRSTNHDCPCIEGNCQCSFCTASRMRQVTVPRVVEAPPSVESVSIFANLFFMQHLLYIGSSASSHCFK